MIYIIVFLLGVAAMWAFEHRTTIQGWLQRGKH
jgi:hypothetical protein